MSVRGPLVSYVASRPRARTAGLLASSAAIQRSRRDPARPGAIWRDPRKKTQTRPYARFDATAPIASRDVSALGGAKAEATADGKSARATELLGVADDEA